MFLQNKSLEDELEKKSRVLEEHGIKIKTMKDDMTSKNKQIKELEREVSREIRWFGLV